MAWKLLSDERDGRSPEFSEADFSKADFLMCLNKDGERITGEEKLKHLKDSGRIRYGATVFAGLWKDYQDHKENSAPERLYQERGITCMDFFGDVLLDPDGGRLVLCPCRDSDDEWRWDCGWLAHGWATGRVSAVSQ